MAYLHQLPLLNAVKRLYMMGHSDRKKKTKGPNDAALEGLGGAMFGAAKSAGPQPNTNEQAPELTADQKADRYGMWRQGTSAGQGMAMGQADGPTSEYDQNPYKAAQNRLNMNKVAEETRIGGQMTARGLEKADREATDNAIDRLRLQQMMGPQLGRGSF